MGPSEKHFVGGDVGLLAPPAQVFFESTDHTVIGALILRAEVLEVIFFYFGIRAPLRKRASST